MNINSRFDETTNIYPIEVANESNAMPQISFDFPLEQASEIPEKIEVASGTSFMSFSIQQIRNFLKNLHLDEAAWEHYFLEDALMTHLYTGFEKETNLTAEKYETFFFLIYLLRTPTDYSSTEFTKNFKVFNKNKLIDSQTEMYICLLANVRSLQKKSLGEIFGKKGKNLAHSTFLSAQTQGASIKYILKYMKIALHSLEIEEKSSKKSADNNPTDQVNHQMVLFKKRWDLVSRLLAHPVLNCKENELRHIEIESFLHSLIPCAKFLGVQYDQIINSLLSFQKEATNIVTLVSDMLGQMEKEQGDNPKRISKTESDLNKKLSNLMIAELNGKKGDPQSAIRMELIKGAMQKPVGGKSVNWGKSQRKQLKQEKKQAPSLAGISTTPTPKNEKISLQPYGETKQLLNSKMEDSSKLLESQMASLQRWNLVQRSLFSQLISTYTQLANFRKEKDCEGKPLWLLLGDELIEEEREAQQEAEEALLTKLQSKLTTSTTSTNAYSYSTSSSEEDFSIDDSSIKYADMALPLFLEALPECNQRLAQNIKKFLTSTYPADISSDARIKAEKATEELDDHMHLATLHVMLFAEAIFHKDFKTLGICIPFLFLDLHIQIEQWMKHRLILETGDYPATHSLIELSTLSPSFNFTKAQKAFIQQFDYAMLQARFPISSQALYQNTPQVLQWIQFSTNIAKANNAPQEDMVKLISFVVDSYKQARSFFSAHTEEDGFTDRLDLCKQELQNSLFQKNDNWTLENPNNNYSSIILDKRTELLKEITDTPKTAPEVEPLLEAADHLLRADLACHVKENYKHPRFAPLHQRNAFITNWAVEQQFAAEGLKKGLGDFRWTKKRHDLCVSQSLLSQNTTILAELRPINFGRAIHYSRERQKQLSLPMIQNVLTALDLSKANKVNKKFEDHWHMTMKQNVKLLKLV